MVIIVTILLPVNYNGGKGSRTFVVGNKKVNYHIKGLDTLSWQNVAPTQTNRYWAHLVCAILAISWTLFRIYREKLHFIKTRQAFLTSPEQRLKASSKTILVTNIPSEYRSEEALKALFDVFVDNDDRSKLQVWLNRDFSPLRKLVAKRRKLCHALEKEELKILRSVNKKYHDSKYDDAPKRSPELSTETSETREDVTEAVEEDSQQIISDAFERDCHEQDQPWRRYLGDAGGKDMKISQDESGDWTPSSTLKRKQHASRTVPKIAWYRAEIARLTVQIEEMLTDLSNVDRFKRQNSAFIQFDRQMAANMATSLVAHHKVGYMSPRFLHVAPHEILWPNMGLTSLHRFLRTIAALALFVGMAILWGIPAVFIGILSQLETLRNTTSWLYWLRSWPKYLISFISGKSLG